MKINNFWCCFILSVIIVLVLLVLFIKIEGMIEVFFLLMGEFFSKISENEENEFYVNI